MKPRTQAECKRLGFPCKDCEYRIPMSEEEIEQLRAIVAAEGRKLISAFSCTQPTYDPCWILKKGGEKDATGTKKAPISGTDSTGRVGHSNSGVRQEVGSERREHSRTVRLVQSHPIRMA